MLERIGRFITDAPEKWSAKIILLPIIFAVFGAANFCIQFLLRMAGFRYLVRDAVVSAIVGGLATFTAWFFLEAAKTERVRIRRELENEARLNHEVRNALELINQAGYLIQDLHLKEVVSESVKRIDLALKERSPR